VILSSGPGMWVASREGTVHASIAGVPGAGVAA
jgi:hypothetical protein